MADNNNSDFPFFKRITVVDASTDVERLKSEIKNALLVLNSISLDEQVSHIADLITNHPLTYATSLLAPRTIWDIIRAHNAGNSISEIFNEEQERRYLNILSFEEDIDPDDLEFGTIGPEDLEG